MTTMHLPSLPLLANSQLLLLQALHGTASGNNHRVLLDSSSNLITSLELGQPVLKLNHNRSRNLVGAIRVLVAPVTAFPSVNRMRKGLLPRNKHRTNLTGWLKEKEVV
jgi:CMP-N-acetylneuraminic acid synthetase